MKWKRSTNTLLFGKRDVRIMTQCRMQAAEIFGRSRPNSRIPPLWSVLSYVMLQCEAEDAHIWRRYRMLTELAKNPASGYRRHRIPKSNGQTRTLWIPGGEVRRQQRFIIDQILRRLAVDEHACAYRKGIGIRNCAEPHVGKAVLIHLDIRDFFGSITEDMVYEMFRRETGYEKSLCRFLARMCTLGGKLPQGALTSPMLSNILFRECDEALSRLAEAHGMVYTRYSDDLFFSGDAAGPVDTFLREASAAVSRHGFRLNTDKTGVRRQQHRQTVLGLTVNRGLQVNRDYRRRLMQELYYLERYGPNCTGAREQGDYEGYLRRLQGRLAYVIQMDPDNIRLRTAMLMVAAKLEECEIPCPAGFL